MNQLQPIPQTPLTPITPTVTATPTPIEEPVPAAEPAPIPIPEEPDDRDELIATLREALLTAKAQIVCARLGVSEARTAYVLRLANLDAIDDPLVADAAIREAVQAVLADVPELRGAGTGAYGAFRVRRAPAKDAFERGFEQK